MSFLDEIAAKAGFVRKSSLRRQMPPQSKRDFSGAQTGRLFADWSVSNSSRNDKIQRSLVLMRMRSRDLCESNEWAINFIGKCKTNIVGPEGIPMKNQAQTAPGVLDRRANDIINEAWQDWCKPKNCTVTGDMSFTDSLHLLVETEPQDGEFLTRIVRNFSGNHHRFALQHLEADCLDEQYQTKLPSGSTIRMGVERDEWKKRTAYWLRKENPNDMLGVLGAIDRVRVPADEIIHKFIRTAPNQVRGFPWFFGAMESMHMLAAYDEASVVAARNGACKGGFYKPLPNSLGDYPATEDSEGNLTEEVAPGQMNLLPPGYDFMPYDPAYPHDQYPQFVKMQLRRIASALRVSYNGLANDLEGVNFSSIRAGLLDERDIWKLLQRSLIQDYCQRVFSEWLAYQLLTGSIIDLPAARRYYLDRPRFYGRRWPWVDPEKDVNANILAVANGFTTRSAVAAEASGDFEEICIGQAHDAVVAADQGLNFDSAKAVERANYLGVNVRAGLITPTLADEEKLREESGLPAMSPEARAAWESDGGVRRPITLQSQSGFENAQDTLGAKPAPPTKKTAA